MARGNDPLSIAKESLKTRTASGKKQPCKRCKTHPADGSDELCSPCRNEEGNDPVLVRIPDVVNQTRYFARNKIAATGLIASDSRSSLRENKDRRGSNTLHEGERVARQNPSPGERVPRGSTITLDYAFSGEIIYATEEENGYLGTLIEKDDQDRLHSDSGPAFVDLPRKGVYQEIWYQHGKKGRRAAERDLAAKITHAPDGTITEYWYEDDLLAREGAAAAISRKGDQILEEVFWAVIDGQSVTHRSDGPAVIQSYPNQERLELYFLEGQEMSRDEWEKRRAGVVDLIDSSASGRDSLGVRIEEHLMKEESS